MAAISPRLSREKKDAAFLPYGRQAIDEDDIAAVTAALRSDYLTTGPLVGQFESALSSTIGAEDSVVCANGTAALYMATRALGLGAGHTIIVPAITFLATASAPHLAGVDIVFSDVDPETGLMRASDLEEALTRAPNGRADAVFPVHYAGQSCDMPSIAAVARAHEMKIVEDAAHALGTMWLAEDGAVLPVGANAFCDLTVFSFHPVKTIAMGEGGAVSTNDPAYARALRGLRNHGITRDNADFVRADAAFDQVGDANPWYYELQEPGFNLRAADINCALGLSQLAKLPRFVAGRAHLVSAYDALLAPHVDTIRPLARDPRSASAWHIYPVRIDFAGLRRERGTVMRALAQDGIGTQVHYIPVHQQPYYAQRYATPRLPGADIYYSETLSLPLYPGMDDDDVTRVVTSLLYHLGG